MPKVADYSIIRDAWAGVGELEEMTWTLPVTADLGSRSILMFMFQAVWLWDTARLRVRINGKEIFTGQFPEKRLNPFHEVIPANLLRHGENVINFDVTGDDLVSCQVSDVVLFWQANV